jgi:hypothetical protein
MRPTGDPASLAAAGRGMAAAADELERLARQAAAATTDLVAGGGWEGPASRAYLVRDGALEAGARAAAVALGAGGECLARLSTGLAGAQTTWDQAARLAASSGLALDPAVLPESAVTPGPLVPPLPSTDPRVAVAARVGELVHNAAAQAVAADRAAAAGLAEATRLAAAARPAAGPVRGHGGAAALPGHGDVGVRAGRGGVGALPGHGGAPAGGGGGAPPGHGGVSAEGGGALGRALDLAERAVVTLGAGLSAIRARAEALLRLVRSGQEPAAALGAVRALAAFERSSVAPMVGLLPVAGLPLTLAANLAGDEYDGEPVLRTVARSLGESLGAEAGQRLGIAACGVDVATTGAGGAILCPAVTMVTASVGASLGGAAAVRIYDALGPEPAGSAAPPERAAPATDPVPRDPGRKGGPR